MTTWITKELTLDLLAITIDGLNKVFNRINNDTAVDPATAHPADLPAAPAQEDAPAPAVAPEPEPADAPTEDTIHTPPNQEEAAALLVEAQNTLRLIAQKGGVEWITGTLFPHFGKQSLTDVPAEQLPDLIAMATERLEQVTA